MKPLLIIIALLVLGIAPASAGEIDGKALICQEDGEKDKYSYRVHSFRDGKVKTISAPKKKNWREKGFVTIRATPSYRVKPFEIHWPQSSEKDNKAFYKVSRKTLRLSYKDYFTDREFTASCKVSLNKDVPAFFDENIRKMEDEMKKNKL